MDSTQAADAAHEFAAQFARESFENAAARLTDDGRENVVESFPEDFQEGPMDAEDALEQYWWGLYGQYGEFEEVGDVNSTDGEAAVELVFEDGTETATVGVGEDGVSASAASGVSEDRRSSGCGESSIRNSSSDGRSESDGVTDLSFSPEYEVPEYVDTEAFNERDVTVDAGDVDLDGVFAVPEGEGPFPGVVLVHGAGIHTPDGTVGASKILKDVAWGLASEGIATLRYEKRLNEHEVADEDFTLDTIVTDDAVAATNELASADEVATDAVFVAGHSQGGMTAPRIAERHGDVAGIVTLDGPSDPTVDPDDLSFMRYSFEVDGDLSEEQEEQLEAQRETFRRIAEGDFEADEDIMGKPGTWHQSIMDCDPLGTIDDIDVPTFVAKSGRADEELQEDLVAFLRENFETWQAADLPSDSRCEFYEDVEHYLQDGPTPVTMDSLYFGGNVADYVVDDIAAWIHDVAER